MDGVRVSQFKIEFDGESLITPETLANHVASPAATTHENQLIIAKAEIALILNITQQQVDQGQDPGKIIDRLARSLHETRGKFHPMVWQEIIPIVQNHELMDFFQQDPFTRWSFDKPRGYSGDAQLLDFIYGHPSVAHAIDKASPVGLALYDYTKDASSSVAVRERRDLLTRHVDEIAAERGPDTEILTIAAGHLREANRSEALKQGQLKRWVALDQDPLSIGSITKDFSGTCIEAIDGSVKGLLTGAHEIGKFDFIYAAGLYDYLTHKVSVKLTRRCMQMLKPGGVFLFANFAEEIGVDGYMETFMNWGLLLRSEADMWNIIDGSVDRNTVDASVFYGENRNIVYGLMKKHD